MSHIRSTQTRNFINDPDPNEISQQQQAQQQIMPNDHMDPEQNTNISQQQLVSQSARQDGQDNAQPQERVRREHDINTYRHPINVPDDEGDDEDEDMEEDGSDDDLEEDEQFAGEFIVQDDEEEDDEEEFDHEMSSSAPQPPTTVTSNAGQSSTTDDAPSRPTRRNPQSSALPPQEETEEEIAKKKQAEEDRARHQTEMRKQILCIQQDSSIPAAEKAKRIQELMTAKWTERQKTTNTRAETAKNKLRDRATDFNTITDADKEPTYHDAEKTILGCRHYQRGAKLQAHCCGKWFTCRFCHDEVSDHNIIRSEYRNLTSTMMCMSCSHVQPAGQDCTNCGKSVAKYYCKECKLWDNDPKKNIYHCHDCGICRIGRGLGIDYFHCKKCNVCMAISLKGRHKCIERNLESDCPICGEYMFTSTTTVIFMPCGHCIHYKCHQEYIQTNYQCPTCFKSLANMTEYFKRIDAMLAQHKMPAEYENWASYILCNDCEKKSEAKYHFLYHKCGPCGSYNTKVLKTGEKKAGHVGPLFAIEAAGSGSGSSSDSPTSPMSGTSESDSATPTTGVNVNSVLPTPPRGDNAANEGNNTTPPANPQFQTPPSPPYIELAALSPTRAPSSRITLHPATHIHGLQQNQQQQQQFTNVTQYQQFTHVYNAQAPGNGSNSQEGQQEQQQQQQNRMDLD